MKPFEFVEPLSLPEALGLLDPDDAAVRPMSGGTALMLMMKAGVLRPSRLVSLQRLGLESIEIGPAGELRIGAMATLSAIEHSPVVRRGWPMIARTLRTLANVRVRNVARLGGGLAHADPHMDLPPLLAALGATATIAGPRGERTAPVLALSSGYLETTIRRNELIVRVDVPPLAGRSAAYLKATTRSADDWPALGVAVSTGFEQKALKDPVVVMSAATDRPTRLFAAESVLKGAIPDAGTLQRAGEAAAAEVRIESDLHGSAGYKMQLLRVYLGRAIREASTPSR